MAKLYFRYAAMNAGKSTQLLQIEHNYRSLGRSVRLLTAAVDDRFGVGTITSRLGVSSEADVFTPTTDMFDLVSQYRASVEDHSGRAGERPASCCSCLRGAGTVFWLALGLSG